MTTNPATVIAVTGPAGHDIGPAAAWLGRNLGDGLAVRIVPSSDGLTPHTSPNPYPVADPPDSGSVVLWCLPSAWQHPDTNLGVVYTGAPTGDLRIDLNTLRDLGVDAGHRVTVQHGGFATRDGEPIGHPLPAPVEVGNLAEIARDSVLRGAGRHRTVLLEAGDGQTFLDAFHAFGLAPWNTHIDVLELWVVIDVAQCEANVGGLGAAVAAQIEVARQGGGHNRHGARPASMYLALRNVHTLVPELAGLNSARFARDPEDGGEVSEAVADRVGAMLTVIEHRAGARVHALSTGPAAGGGPEQWIDLNAD